MLYDSDDNSITQSDSSGTSLARFGITESAEKINGRFAMLGILGTTLVELVGGHPVLQLVGIR